MVVASLSPQHTRIAQEKTIGPLAKLIAALRSDPGKLARLRTEYEEMIGEVFEDNALHLHFIMARGRGAVARVTCRTSRGTIGRRERDPESRRAIGQGPINWSSGGSAALSRQ